MTKTPAQKKAQAKYLKSKAGKASLAKYQKEKRSKTHGSLEFEIELVDLVKSQEGKNASEKFRKLLDKQSKTIQS